MARPTSHSRGAVLIVALWIIVAMTGMVLTLAFSARTEAMAAANRVAEAQADAALRGTEQWLLSVVDQEQTTPGTIVNTDMQARQIGQCLVWVIRPDHDNSTVQAFGLTDEAGKLDLNTDYGAQTHDMLMMLPGMTEDVADAIIDWRDSDSTVSTQGAEDDYYMSLPEPYHCKNAPYESLDELLLVKGVTTDLLYGYDHNRNGIIDGNEGSSGNPGTVFNAAGNAGNALNTAGNPGNAFNAAGDAGVGFAPYVTVYGIQAMGTSTASASSSSTGSSASSGSSGSSSSGSTVNVNSTNTGQLSTLLSNSISSSRAQEIISAVDSGRPFANVFDFYFRARLNQDEFTKIYPQITAVPVAANTSGASGGTGGAGGAGSGGQGGGANGGAGSASSSGGRGNSDGGGSSAGGASSGSGTASSGGAASGAGAGGTASAGAVAATPTSAKVNINTAPREVLVCLPGLTESDADAIVSQRQGTVTGDDPTNIAWLASIIDQTKAASMGGMVTGLSKVFSGDIVAISPDGRAFRRCRIVISAQNGSARIVYRRDLTTAGWPLPLDVREAIRSGEGYEAPLSGGTKQ